MKKMEVVQKVEFYNGEVSEDLQKQTSVESTMDVYEVWLINVHLIKSTHIKNDWACDSKSKLRVFRM